MSRDILRPFVTIWPFQEADVENTSLRPQNEEKLTFECGSWVSTQQVHDHYVGLQKVERDFRTLKTGLLEVRPVFLRNKHRTRGHVLACLLALKLSREMERRLRAVFGTTETNPYAVTLPDALTAMSRLCLLHYRVDEKTVLTRLPKPDARQEEILKALQVPLPGQSL